jgi:hypothetical protein
MLAMLFGRLSLEALERIEAREDEERRETIIILKKRRRKVGGSWYLLVVDGLAEMDRNRVPFRQ